MATALSRSSNCLRNIHRYLQFYTSSRCGSLVPASSTVDTVHHRAILPLQSVVPVDGGMQSWVINQRYLFSTTVGSSTGNIENGESKSSGGGDHSGGSHQSSSDTGKPVRGGPVSWMSFLLLVATGAGLIYYYDKEKKRHIEDISNASKAVKEGPSAGKAAIGGPFNLINHEGKRVTEKDFLGKWSIIYFGFTHCPDICPDELQKLAAAVDKIKFHPKLIGLTGSPDEIKSVARAYRVYYMKTAEEDSDYLVDHSIVMYLMSPDMEFVKFFGKNNDVDSLSDGVVKEIKQHKK